MPTAAILAVVVVVASAVLTFIALHFTNAGPRNCRRSSTASCSAMPGQQVQFWMMPGEGSALPRRTAWLRTSSGKRYGFVFVQFPDGRCRAYIQNAPSYGCRPSSLLATHRRTDSRSRQYVCFEPEPRSRKQLLTVVSAWMHATDKYRTTGTFETPSWSA